ncbi:MAG: large conductance mechanosensitive channel protein MscL [Actinomycetia bacterium]|nr:large conductance mechanosensitive channel protein MscL [Actinomycetes bacterium]
MLKEFKDFIMRGNVIDLAVAVVVGAAFGAVVTALVDSLIMPLIALLVGQPNFNELAFTINDTTFQYGVFLTAVVNFLLIAAAIFLFVIKPITAVNARFAKDEEATERECPECLSEVSVKATKCKFCTSELTPTA